MNRYKLQFNDQTLTLHSEFGDWNIFLKEFKERLNFLNMKKADEKVINQKEDLLEQFQLYFSFSKQLDEKQLSQLILLCHDHQIIFRGFKDKQESKEIQVIYKVHAGDYLETYTPILIMDDVGKDVHIKAYDSVIVNGIIKGTIDLVHKHCSCTCLGFQDGRIRIYDQSYQNLTIFSYVFLYYQDHKMIIQKEVN